ncbi:response regulator transcription factor [Chryseobacterium sp. FH1]|uniref:response regulator transcription factor n=1 Tax=Chryseobacterium sp. FH1 TaxID=1233951 RepID=UPI001E52AF62|nr:helix-turn-helix transcriptional regulator [Chryseobacterium sp. FH1]
MNENFQNLLGYRNHLIVGLLVLLVSTSVYNYQRIKFYKRYIRKRNLEFRRLRESVKFYKNLPNLNIIDDSQVLENDSLNDRQKEIVLQMLKGFTNAEIAEKLFIAETTVKYHIKNIYKIYDVKNRSQLYKKFAVKPESVSK